ncbi:hypothetical protein LN650_00635 [Klebsiella pneumoniae subsp. pneumoniae]|nr:hypothetical protein [Klebsiella pneumoniae subsp. pneumoniae]
MCAYYGRRPAVKSAAGAAVQLRVSGIAGGAAGNSCIPLGTHWNISLFHYRSHGTDYGRVLAAFELGEHGAGL